MSGAWRSCLALHEMRCQLVYVLMSAPGAYVFVALYFLSGVMTLAIWQRDAKKEADASASVASKMFRASWQRISLLARMASNGLALALFSSVALALCAGALLLMSGARRSCLALHQGPMLR